MGVNFKKVFYEARLCRVLFKSIAVGDSINHHFSLKMTFSTARNNHSIKEWLFFGTGDGRVGQFFGSFVTENLLTHDYVFGDSPHSRYQKNLP